MNAHEPQPDKPGFAKLKLDRLNGLSDGVIAIVITLLVLGIDIPEHHDFSVEGLISFLAKVEYQATVYAVSFALIASYWMQHSVMFHFFRFGSRRLAWLNLLFLFELTLLPFTTKLIGTYRNEPLPIVVYGAVHVVCGCSLGYIWWYANRAAPIVWPRIDPAVARSILGRILAGPVVSLVAIGVAFFNVRLAHVVFLSMPFFQFSHRTADTHWPQIVGNDGSDAV
jgi:uncharacterized membrane protein